MPPSPPEPIRPQPVVLIKSPRDATTWALVYRRRIRERPRDRWLKVLAMIGALLVHVLFLLGSMVGSPYEELPPPEPTGNPLLVRLINNKPVPPPPPPVRGIPPKEHGPTHRGNTAQAVHATHEISTAAPVAAVQQPPVPAPRQPPVVSPKKLTFPPWHNKPVKVVAAPLPPISLPKPAPTPIPQPKPVGLPPAAVALQAVQVPQPIPPQFQPEPPRKPQPEGTQPMPPLPSLAVPVQPAQSALTATPPQIAVEKPSLAPVEMPQVATVPPAPAPAAPPAPALQPVPLPAQAAPTVNLQASATPLEMPSVQRIAPQVEMPAVQAPPQEAQLAPVPATPTVAPPIPNLAPSAPALSVSAPKLAVPAISVQPQLSASSAATPATAQTQPAEASSSEHEKTAQSTSPPSSSNPASSSTLANEVNASASTAPNATPQGSETGNPGQPNGVSQPSENSGTQGTQPSSTNGAGNTANAQGNGTPGSPTGSYIQLKPRGDTEIMSHNTNLPKYQPTRFDQYWTPRGESSIDTALRHAAEKTTVSHTFDLPKGIHIKCAVRPLVPVALFGCGGADPPAAPLPQKMYDRLNLPSANASIPKVAPAAAATQAAPAPVQLDNSAECAAARVSGGPMPPNCPPTAPVQPLKLPAPGSGSWVPASDQFH